MKMRLSHFSWPPKRIKKFETFQLVEAESLSLVNFPYMDLMIGDVLNYGQVIATGEQSEIRLCMHTDSKAFFCVKIQPYVGEEHKKELLRVSRLQSSMDHPAIVKLYTSMSDERSVYHILEYIPGGDLFQRVSAVGVLSESVTKNYTSQLVLAVEYIHSRGYVHNDIKLENILIDEEGNVKLTDFALAMLQNECSNELVSGTPQYMSPERLMDEPLDESSDWWSVGVCCFEMLTGSLPFGMKDNDEPNVTFQKVLSGRLVLPPTLSQNAANFVVGLLTSNKEDRLGYCAPDEIKDHPWLDDIEWETILPMPKEAHPKFIEGLRETSSHD